MNTNNAPQQPPSQQQVLNGARELLDSVEIGWRDEDERAATAWVVELIDPEVRAGEYGHRRLVGSFGSLSDAQAGVERIDREINPYVAIHGCSALQATIVPVVELRP